MAVPRVDQDTTVVDDGPGSPDVLINGRYGEPVVAASLLWLVIVLPAG